jgi:hypothetical protein
MREVYSEAYPNYSEDSKGVFTNSTIVKLGGVASEYGRLKEGLDALEKEIEALSASLQSVLRPDEPTADGGSGKHETLRRSVFADTISEDANRLQAFQYRLRQLRTRIDL